MKAIIVIWIGLALAGCGTVHSLGSDRLRLGMTKAEVDREFATQNTSTGNWTTTLMGKQSSGGKEETIYRYWWKKTMISIDHSAFYEAVFIDGRLASYRLVPPGPPPAIVEQTSRPKEKKLDDMCKWAIQSGDKGGVATFC